MTVQERKMIVGLQDEVARLRVSMESLLMYQTLEGVHQAIGAALNLSYGRYATICGRAGVEPLLKEFIVE